MSLPSKASKSREFSSCGSLEEREGLLTDSDGFESFDDPFEKEPSQTDSDAWPRSKIIKTAIAFILLLIFGTFSRILLRSPPASHPNISFNGDYVRSNGTHDFKRTVLIVSIDGLRADYLDRGFTPHLLEISKRGLRAKSMVPIFPTLTFPNHWALMTGLHAESHGIIANNFWDPQSNLEFHYNKISSAWNPDFWLGEPMWETANKAGIITANLMWPGPPKTKSGAAPTYFVPWKDKVPLSVKLDQLLQWIDLPFEERPQLLMAYEPSLDQAGHLTGPMSALVNQTLSQVDLFAAALHDSLADRNLTDIVDIVFVSDHGMTDTSHPTLIYVDDEDMLGEQGLSAVIHEDGWPAMGMRFNSKQNESHYLEKLLDSQHPHAEGFDVYSKETMPSRWHFAHHDRIAPVWIVPKIGYALTTREEGDVGMSKGNHGYDNNELSMHAMFVAHGPFSAVVKDLHKSSFKAWLPWKNKGWHSTSDDTYVMDTFPNVEIYGLVAKLLGMEESSSPNNGTAGFWDKYF
ncbi:Phosphodiest-domain-containing protein [Gymnopus androsaceus JB14]|uniref:Phosphodiest-domain-containing protein n=1 Tax=Gymnopus androsaceus JB14 TaxID=1447944 RepID=A0A6A4IGP1_9AGAR|nr:Phosphodiest-domain-containing protein [Gymnopus androsaceus JB14]